jgi:competence protein ComEA
MTKREIYALYGIVAVFALGLLFHGLSRYRFYQNYIDISPPAAKYYERDRSTGEYTDGDRSSQLVEEVREEAAGDLHSDVEVGMIDVNSATLYDLIQLPGIGKVTALNIIDYRTVHGPFRSVDELIEVKGIGEKKLEMLKPYVNIR